MRIGHGYDVHRLVPGRKLILGGVEIPFERGLDGHSDADVLTHALMDALLGAACLGDIGLLFPDNDPQYKGHFEPSAAGGGRAPRACGGLCRRQRRYHRPMPAAEAPAPYSRPCRNACAPCSARRPSMSRRRPRKASALRAAARASPATPCVCWRNAHENASDHRL